MLLQGRSHKLKGEEGLGGEDCVVFAPFSLSAGTLLPQIVSSSFATCALVLGDPQGAHLCEQRCGG